ncbi:hypothetical protein D3C77_456460 [compost metagenome]
MLEQLFAQHQAIVRHRLAAAYRRQPQRRRCLAGSALPGIAHLPIAVQFITGMTDQTVTVIHLATDNTDLGALRLIEHRFNPGRRRHFTATGHQHQVLALGLDCRFVDHIGAQRRLAGKQPDPRAKPLYRGQTCRDRLGIGRLADHDHFVACITGTLDDACQTDLELLKIRIG